MFTAKDLSKSVKGKQILNNVSFNISRGHIGLFLGGSGVGKSTLFRILNNLETYENGVFTLDGLEFNLASADSRQHIGMVFQHFNLFEHLSVEENIILPLTKLKGSSKDKARESTHALLQCYGIHDKAKSSVHKLSGGQKQRLAIARTLALNPDVICMDEPTSALDPALTAQVAACITEIAHSGRIVLVSTHDMQLLELLEATAYFMQAGTIVESALTYDYRKNPADYPLMSKFVRPI